MHVSFVYFMLFVVILYICVNLFFFCSHLISGLICISFLRIPCFWWIFLSMSICAYNSVVKLSSMNSSNFKLIAF